MHLVYTLSSHFLSHLGSVWGGTPGVTFESLLADFNPFYVSVKKKEDAHFINIKHTVLRILDGPIRTNRFTDSRESHDSRESCQGRGIPN